jgi:integrase/DNA-binding XRE family transcriptional regulator
MADDDRAVTLAAYAARFLRQIRQRRKFRTYEGYENLLRNHVLPAFGAETPLTAIRRAAVKDFLTERAESGYARAMVFNMLRVLRALLNAAVEDELLEGNVALRLTKYLPRAQTDPREKAMPREHLERFLRAVRRRHRLLGFLYLILARCGLRLSEGLALRWEDVDLEGRLLHVRHALDYRYHLDTPKSGRARTVDLGQDACAALRAMLALADPGVPWLFPSSLSPLRPWSRAHVRRVMLRVLAEENLPLRTCHALRHSFASHLADQGVNPWVLKELLGHHDITVTQGYVHPVSRHREAVELLDHRDDRNESPPSPGNGPPNGTRARPMNGATNGTSGTDGPSRRGPATESSALIRAWRVRLGLSQDALARVLFTTQPTVNRWENGHVAPSKAAWRAIEALAAERRCPLTA